MRKFLLILSLLISTTAFAQNKKSFLRDGNTLYTDSSYNEAEMQYRKSLEKDQDYFNASFNLADAVYKQERYSESSGLFDALKDNASTNKDLTKVSDDIYDYLKKNSIDVLYDDTSERPGEKFANMDLIGVPFQIILGKKYLKDNCFELKDRKTNKIIKIKDISEILTKI